MIGINDDSRARLATEIGGASPGHDTTEDWQLAHHELLRLAHEQAALDAEQGLWLLRALRCSTHLRLGFATFSEYAGRLFGFSHRLVTDKLRAAEALEELPSLAGAVGSGELSWSAARELTRVVAPTTEAG